MATFTFTIAAIFYQEIVELFREKNFYIDGEIKTITQTASLETTILRMVVLTDRSTEMDALLDAHEYAFLAILEG